jgi:hypothetical protein
MELLSQSRQLTLIIEQALDIEVSETWKGFKVTAISHDCG